jgi:hypothetical protein
LRFRGARAINSSSPKINPDLLKISQHAGC